MNQISKLSNNLGDTLGIQDYKTDFIDNKRQTLERKSENIAVMAKNFT